MAVMIIIQAAAMIDNVPTMVAANQFVGAVAHFQRQIGHRQPAHIALQNRPHVPAGKLAYSTPTKTLVKTTSSQPPFQ